MVTMLDVAKRAGVSKATVSRVLNGKNIVRPEVTEAVFKAIEETGYRPNLLARQMATQKSSMIGLVITNALYNGPYFSEMVYRAAAFSEQHQHQLILADGKNSKESEQQAIRYLQDMKCAGIVVYPHYLGPESLMTIISNSSIPIVVVNRELAGHEQHSIIIDHVHSGALMTDYLLSQGHRDIAFITGRAESPSNLGRLAGYKQQLAHYQIASNEALLVEGDWTPDGGYKAAQQLLAQPTPFTAILAGNDDMAIGAMKALREAGYQLPEDVAIAGFDDITMGQYVSPSLTTIHVPIEKMMERAISQVMGSPATTEAHRIRGELIIRDSVNALPRR